MIHYLCKAGEFDMAYSMCKDSMQKNWFPNVDTIYKLLEGMKKDGKVEKARFIVTLAQKRIPPFPPVQLGAMKSILSRS